MSRKLSQLCSGLSCSARYALTASRSFVSFNFDQLRDLTHSDSAFLAILEIWRSRMERMSRGKGNSRREAW